MNDGKAVVDIIECDVNGMELAHGDVLRTKSNLVVELYAANEFPGSFVGFLTQYNGTIRGYRHLYAHGRVGRAVHDERQDAGGRTSEGGVVLDCEKHKHGIAQASRDRVIWSFYFYVIPLRIHHRRFMQVGGCHKYRVTHCSSAAKTTTALNRPTA